MILGGGGDSSSSTVVFLVLVTLSLRISVTFATGLGYFDGFALLLGAFVVANVDERGAVFFDEHRFSGTHSQFLK